MHRKFLLKLLESHTAIDDNEEKMLNEMIQFVNIAIQIVLIGNWKLAT